MSNEAEVKTAIREFTWFEKNIGNNLLRIIYVALTIYIASTFLGFPSLALSETQLQQIVIGSAAAMGIGICWVVFRSYRRMRLDAGKKDGETSADAGWPG